MLGSADRAYAVIFAVADNAAFNQHGCGFRPDRGFFIRTHLAVAGIFYDAVLQTASCLICCIPGRTCFRKLNMSPVICLIIYCKQNRTALLTDCLQGPVYLNMVSIRRTGFLKFNHNTRSYGQGNSFSNRNIPGNNVRRKRVIPESIDCNIAFHLNGICLRDVDDCYNGQKKKSYQTCSNIHFHYTPLCHICF